MISEASIKSAPHSVFDHSYEILDHVGRGRSSIVYKARKLGAGGLPNPDAPVIALKVILGNAKLPALNQKRMRHEALAMLACRHPNVIRLLDFVTSGDLNYLAMEYAERGDLGAILEARTEPLSQQLALSLVAQLLGGLDAIHRAGIIHRDVKPENLLLTEDMVLKVADFGIAHLPTELPSRDDSERGIGTFEYLAPESLERGVSNQLTDLYSAAVTSFQLLTKRLPFEGSTFAKQVELKLSGSRPTLASLIPEPLPFLEELLTKALSYDPAGRFQTAAEFKEAIEQLLAGRWHPGSNGGTVTLTPEEVQTVRGEEPETLIDDSAEAVFEADDSLTNAMPWLLAEEAIGSDQDLYDPDVAIPGFENVPTRRRRRGLASRFFIGGLLLGALVVGIALAAGTEATKQGVRSVLALLPDSVEGEITAKLHAVRARLASPPEESSGSIVAPETSNNTEAEEGASEQVAKGAPPMPTGPITAVGGERIGTLVGLLGDGVQTTIVFSTVARRGDEERVVVALGLPGWKPKEIAARQLFAGEPIRFDGAGLQVELQLDKAKSDEVHALTGRFSELRTSRGGSWRAQ